MASGAALLSKVSSILKRTNVTSREVSFRTVQTSGGNALLGLGQSVTSLDLPVDPPPVVMLLKPEEVAAGGSLLQLGDYSMLFAGSVSEETLKTSEIVYGSDVLKIISYEPIVFDGIVVAWNVIARTSKAQQ